MYFLRHCLLCHLVYVILKSVFSPVFSLSFTVCDVIQSIFLAMTIYFIHYQALCVT